MEFDSWPTNKIRKAANKTRANKISRVNKINQAKINRAANKTKKPRAAKIRADKINAATTSNAAKNPTLKD
jgi:hypothetical protein